MASIWSFYYCVLEKLNKLFLILILVGLFHSGFSQTYIYKGNFKSPQNIVFNILEGELREKNYSYGHPVLLTIRDNQIFKARSISLLDVLFTYREGFLFLGYSDNPYDIVYNFDGEHIYYRDRQYSIDIAFNIFMNGIYLGPTNFVSDVMYTIDGPYTETELFAILYALGVL